MAHFNITSTHGLVGAVVNFSLVLLIYVVNLNLMAEWWFAILALLVLAVVMFTGTIATRKANGNSLSFGQAWLASMSVAFVAQVVTAILTGVLYYMIAPELPDILTEITLEKTRTTMESFGLSGDLLEAQMKELRDTMQEVYTWKGLLKNSAGGMVMWAFVSLIVAAVCKRRSQEFV